MAEAAFEARSRYPKTCAVEGCRKMGNMEQYANSEAALPSEWQNPGGLLA